jgi:hypothetical protein
MSKTPLVLLIAAALVPAACAQGPGDAGPAERAQGRATAAAPGEGGSIESVEHRGTGCGGNSASGAVSPDKQAATSTFSDFLVSSGAGTAPDDASRNCLLMLKIDVPPGWSYSLESVDIRGFADLPAGVTATRKSLYVISGSAVHSTPTARFKGQISNDYNDAEVSPEKPGEWSPCGGGQLLWIATQTEIDSHGKDATGVLSIDSIDTELQWRRCQ